MANYLKDIEICTEYVKSVVAQRMILAIIRIGDVAGGLMIRMNYAVIALMKKSRMTHVLSTVSTVKASMSFLESNEKI